MSDFLVESAAHGWPSFRDAEVSFKITITEIVFEKKKAIDDLNKLFPCYSNKVNWEYVRCLPGGEAVSVDGTHLGKSSSFLKCCSRSPFGHQRARPLLTWLLRPIPGSFWKIQDITYPIAKVHDTVSI
jgi:hypothetical protein